MNRWHVLALLFAVRLGMAFQFQSVASVSPALMKEYGVGLGDIGLLISLYLAPGLAFAIPGGEIGRRFGDKRVVLGGLALMVAGGLIMSFAPGWGWQIAGRLVSGLGGVLLNVLMSKMVTDAFSGREIATAMGIFVNSWPAGIALCLLVTPAIVAAHGPFVAFAVATTFCAAGFVVLALLHRPPATPDAIAAAPRGAWPARRALQAILVAGCSWGLFNAAISMVFGFGTALLVERGWTLAAAGSATSLVLWFVAVSVPLGGLLADRTARPVAVMLAGFALFAAALLVAARTEAVVPAFIALGLVAGISAGPIMSLPAGVLAPRTRAVGMGIYLTMFYAFVVAAPIAAGMLAARFGTTRLAFDLGAVMLALCFPAYWVFGRLARAVSADPASAT